MSVDYIEYEDYTWDNATENISVVSEHLNLTRPSSSAGGHILEVLNVTICLLGLLGNSLVIYICGWKMKRTVITTWYTSLAVSDFLFCAFLPLEVYYLITSHWPFGQVFCKLTSSILFLNMYSSVFLLVLISTDRCVMVSFPVWSHNNRTVGRALAAVVLMWALSGLLTLPSLVFRRTTVHGSVTQCHTSYVDRPRHTAVVLTRFVFGFLIPFLIIVACSGVLAAKMRGLTLRSTKPYRVMAALVLSFFCCWVPYHTFVLLELDFQNHDLEVLHTGLKVGATLASANSFISPVLYVFIGNDFKRTLRRSLTSRIEEALAEDVRTGGQVPSRAKSMEVIRTKLTC